MNKKEMQTITEALRVALAAYGALENGTERAAIAQRLFGVTAPTLLPQLDGLAKSIRPVAKQL